MERTKRLRPRGHEQPERGVPEKTGEGGREQAPRQALDHPSASLMRSGPHPHESKVTFCPKLIDSSLFFDPGHFINDFFLRSFR